MKLPETAEPNQ